MTDIAKTLAHVKAGEFGRNTELAAAMRLLAAGLETLETRALATAVQTITAAGAITLPTAASTLVKVTGPASSTYAITLAAPTSAQEGMLLTIQMIATTSTNAVTLALTNVIGGSAATTASFNAANETLSLVAVQGKWLVIAEAGVTLS